MNTSMVFAPTKTAEFKEIETKRAMGSQICETAANLVKIAVALKEASDFAANKGTRFVCSGTAIATGLSQFYSGNLFVGSMMTLIGTKEMMNIFQSKDASSCVQSLLGDAQAGLRMAQTLGEANENSFKIVDSRLKSVSQNIQILKDRMSEIESLSQACSKELAAKKAQTIQACQEAQELFLQAQQAFKTSEQTMKDSDLLFTKAFEKFDHVIQLTKEKSSVSDSKTLLEAFISQSQAVYQECQNAKDVLGTSSESLNNGLKILDEALAKQAEAFLQIGRVSELAEQEMKAIAQKAETKKINDDNDKNMSEVQTKLKDVQARCADQREILNDTQQDLKKAQELAEQQVGELSFAVGLGAGLLTQAVLGGTLLPAGMGYAGFKIASNHRKISELVFGKDPEPKPQATPQNPVKFEFNSHSTGLWGRYIQKRPSYTAGKICIHLGDEEPFTCKFNLNDKDKLSKTDLEKLANRLLDKLKNPKIEIAQECQNILVQLETIYMDRGDKHKPCRGFISEKNPYFGDLRRQLQARLNVQTG